MEKYLHRCLDSLIVSDEKLQSLEVLVINDGSKDSSSQIAHEYENRYPQTFRVIDKENGNYGSCINRGLKEATGKYVKVLDADDYFETTALEAFVASLSMIDVDMILSEMTYISGKETQTTNLYRNLPSNKVINLVEENLLVLPKLMMHHVCYKTQLLRDIYYVQTEGISYTDQEWIFYPFFFAISIYYSSENLYQYVLGREGQTMNPQTMIRNVNHNKIIAERAFNYYIHFDKMTLPHPNQKELRRQMKYQFGYLYEIYLKKLGDDYDKTSLMEIDDLLKKDPELYKELGNKPYHNFLPIPYVTIWRKTGSRLNLDLLQKFYHKVK